MGRVSARSAVTRLWCGDTRVRSSLYRILRQYALDPTVRNYPHQCAKDIDSDGVCTLAMAYTSLVAIDRLEGTVAHFLQMGNQFIVRRHIPRFQSRSAFHQSIASEQEVPISRQVDSGSWQQLGLVGPTITGPGLLPDIDFNNR